MNVYYYLSPALSARVRTNLARDQFKFKREGNARRKALGVRDREQLDGVRQIGVRCYAKGNKWIGIEV
jgi:hypothetical protein